MKKTIEAIEKEIQVRQEEIQRLLQAKAVLEGKTPDKIIMEKYGRRKIKYSDWSDVEVKQLINLYNTLDMSKGKKMTRIAGILKMPRKRVANKLYNLKLQGLLETKERRKYHRFTKWTPEKIKAVIDLTNNGETPSRISEITRIDVKSINNKLWQLRKQGIVKPIEKKEKESIMDIFKK